MSIDLQTDEQILKALGEQFEALRLHKHIQDAEIVAKGGVGKDAVDKLRNNRGTITLTSLIKILRGLGELNRLEKLFEIDAEYSPTQTGQKAIKRVSRKVSESTKNFTWGDEQ